MGSGVENKTLSLIQDGPNRIYLNEKVLPRAWMVYHVTEVPSGNLDEVKRYLNDSGFDPGREAVVETGTQTSHISLDVQATEVTDSVDIVEYNAHKIMIQVETEEQGLLVLSEIYYPGWRVKVDEKEETILATNLALRGVYLDAGSHILEFSFHPQLFYIGLTISLLTSLAIGAICWLKLKDRSLVSRTMNSITPG